MTKYKCGALFKALENMVIFRTCLCVVYLYEKEHVQFSNIDLYEFTQDAPENLLTNYFTFRDADMVKGVDNRVNMFLKREEYELFIKQS